MDWTKTNRRLSLLANLGVIAGLILVAVQIRQNTAITRAQIANDYFLADMQLELAMMGESPASSWIKAVYAPEELTQEDVAVLDRYFNYGIVQIQRLERMSQVGLADDSWKDQINYLRWHLGNETGRRWWAQYRADAGHAGGLPGRRGRGSGHEQLPEQPGDARRHVSAAPLNNPPTPHVPTMRTPATPSRSLACAPQPPPS